MEHTAGKPAAVGAKRVPWSRRIAQWEGSAMPEIRDRMQAAGVEPTPSTPEALASKYADWAERFGRITKEYGIKPQ